MTESLPPAPLWRRLLAAVYDGLLLLALWMVTVLFDAVLRAIAGAPRNWGTLQICVFVVWLGFFGWFWTHGGQTLGMRVWRLRVVRDDGAPLNWISAAVRYAAMLLIWGIVLTPLIALAPPLRAHPHATIASSLCGLLTVLMLALMLFDRRYQRAPHDWLSSSRLLLTPKPAARKP
jgi:uncharacterized RDD family membrane protein YckC